MSTLTGQYISQSYGGIINLSTNTGIVPGTFTQLQDGLGNNLGVLVNGQSAVSASSFTGSLQGTSSFAVTASYALNAGGTINTGSFATTGSNQFNGNQSVSGSVSISSSINVLPQEVGSTPTSSINRISFYAGYDAGPGVYRDYMVSQTPDFNIGFLYGTEVIRIAGSETTFNTNNVVLNTNLNARGGTVKLGDNTGHNTSITGSLGVSGSTTQTGSVDIQGTVNASSFTGSLDGLATSASFAINAFSASYAATASAFIGIATSASFASTASYVNPLNQPVVFSGSVRGEVSALTISSNTASLNCSADNFFTLQLVQGTNTYINPTNINNGQTINVLISTTGSATVSFPSTIKQISGNSYTPTTTTGKDVITLVSFNDNNLYLVNAKNLV